MGDAADRIAGLRPEIAVAVAIEIHRIGQKLLGMNCPKPMAPA